MNPSWWQDSIAPPSLQHGDLARQRQAKLTKPPGSLGMLEEVACFMAAAQQNPIPQADPVWISIFAADHGVTAENISAFPAVVTGEMIKNFARGGAAINVLANTLGAHLEVIDLGTLHPLTEIPGVQHLNLGPGTTNFRHAPAMTPNQCQQAMAAGRASIERACIQQAKLFIGGDMGIGNTTSASALACALLNLDPADLTGPGTGLSAHGVAHKTRVIADSLAHHRAALTSPWEILRHLGGFEIAALTGAMIRGSQQGLPTLVDGFIVSVAALLAQRLRPECAPWFLYAHRSAEPGHRLVLEALAARPLLSLDMRLGEGSGAAVALPLIRLACALHQAMATFDEAGVSPS